MHAFTILGRIRNSQYFSRLGLRWRSVFFLSNFLYVHILNLVHY
jgi:hypothetical protein